MKETTYRALETLKKALDQDERILTLNVLDQEVNADPKLLELSLEAKKKAEGYANSLYFGQDDPENTPPAQHELYLAKKELDEYPLSQQYQKAYYAVRRLYAELDEILFGPYQYHLSCGGKPHA